MASIKDIAKRARVSTTTVSVVMNGRSKDYGISAKTQERIKKIAAQYNYTPSNLARGLRLKNTKAYGLIVPDLSNWFFSEIAQALEGILNKNGYKLYITSSQYSEDTEFQKVADLMSWNIDGLIIASVMQRDRLAKRVERHNTPIVYIDRRVESDQISWVASNNFKGSYDLVNHICERGAREICYVGGEHSVSTLKNRLAGYKQALKDNGIPYKKELVFEKGSTPQDAYELMSRIHKKWNGFPEAIYTASCDYMMGLLQYIRKQRLELPPGIKLGTFDDNIALDFMEVKIDSVAQDVQAMAAAAYKLMRRAQKGTRNVMHEIIEPKLILRS